MYHETKARPTTVVDAKITVILTYKHTAGITVVVSV